MLGLVLEDAAVERLVHLVDGLPTDLRRARSGRKQAMRFMESRDDLAEVARFVRGITAHVKR